MKKTTFVTCKVKNIIRETEDSVSIFWDIPVEKRIDFDFQSGQHLTLKTKINGEEIRRSYSLSSAPHNQEWRIGVKEVNNGKMSSFLNRNLKVGDAMEIMPPMGNFTLDSEKDNTSYVFFAAGSGITPILSIVTHLLEKTSNQVTLFFGNKGVDNIMYREEIEGLKNMHMERFSVYHIFSKEKLGSPLFMGRIDGKKCKEYHNSLLDKDGVEKYFICGPSTMIFDVEKALLDLGVSKNKIKYELFTTDDIKKVKKDPTALETTIENEGRISNVKVKLDGITTENRIPFTGKPILEVLEELGLDVPYSCKGGVCSTCKAKLMEGKVSMDENYALEEDEVEDGYILTCQSHPLTENIFVDYDQS
jgi:ring-1,2-phenylacetyl-CoA epoxidase subunit PaaE